MDVWIVVFSGFVFMGVGLHAEPSQAVEVLDRSAGLVKRLEDAERRIQLLTDAMDRLNGAVVSFEATTCPEGWREYEAARGRFVRGIDADGIVDPDGVRPPGGVQEDSIRAHSHSISTAGIWGRSFKGENGSPRTAHEATGVTSSFGGAETRPKNVSLLYCIKDTSSVSPE